MSSFGDNVRSRRHRRHERSRPTSVRDSRLAVCLELTGAEIRECGRFGALAWSVARTTPLRSVCGIPALLATPTLRTCASAETLEIKS